jgi:hypothetical protein
MKRMTSPVSIKLIVLRIAIVITIPLHHPLQQRLRRTILKGLPIFSERMFFPAGNRHMDTS